VLNFPTSEKDCTFSPKREEVAGGWRRLYNEELHNLYASQDIIRVINSKTIRWTGHVACMGERVSAYSILVIKPEEKRPRGWLRRRWEDNIRTNLREIGWEVVNWTYLALGTDQWRALLTR
jgi:hypothetical protein